MSILATADGRWKVDVEPVKGRRFRKIFKTKAEALRFEASCRLDCIQPAAWNPKPKDSRKLSALVNRWFDLHGHSITSGRRRKNTLLLMVSRLGDPVATKLTGAHLAELRRSELEAGAVPKSINNRFTYLKAVFNELRRLGDIDYPNPLDSIKPLKFQEAQLTFLTIAQVSTLLAALDTLKRSPSVRLVAEICLATGARWSEAESVTASQVVHDSITFINTKSKRARTVPISPALQTRLHAFFDQHGRFTSCMHSFRSALVASAIKLPRGQATHVLRHTFASHFVMRGGNILTLKEVLGHSSLTMTMRYAHLSPSHLRDALRLNPLDGFDTLATLEKPNKAKTLKNQSSEPVAP